MVFLGKQQQQQQQQVHSTGVYSWGVGDFHLSFCHHFSFQLQCFHKQNFRRENEREREKDMEKNIILAIFFTSSSSVCFFSNRLNKDTSQFDKFDPSFHLTVLLFMDDSLV